MGAKARGPVLAYRVLLSVVTTLTVLYSTKNKQDMDVIVETVTGDTCFLPNQYAIKKKKIKNEAVTRDGELVLTSKKNPCCHTLLSRKLSEDDRHATLSPFLLTDGESLGEGSTLLGISCHSPRCIFSLYVYM